MNIIFVPANLKVNYTKPEYAIADTQTPVFSWGAIHSENGSSQKAYRIVVAFENEILWDSGIVESADLGCVYHGLPLPSGAEIVWTLELIDDKNNKSQKVQSVFKTACFEEFEGHWIASNNEKNHEVICFKKSFELSKKPRRAVLYYCGLGLSKPYLNGKKLENFYLQPAHSNYQKECYYVTTPIDTSMFTVSENTLMVQVAGGWRKNYGAYLDNMSSQRKIEFMGDMCLFAELKLYYEDGTVHTVATDERWLSGNGPITYSHLFNGEVYDQNIDFGNFRQVKISDFKPGKLTPQYIEPVCVKDEIKPVVSYTAEGRRIYDFGENLAGVIKLSIKGECKNARFILRHAEEVSENGGLFTDTLRSAKAEDTFIVRDGFCDTEFVPQFTYHGFRYASLEIEGEFVGTMELTALKFYTDIDTEGFFKCGNQTANELYKTAMRTERANLHSLATDCPQRDERMAWMNDATVRFMAMPYNFNIARLFQKIASDIKNEQDEQGRLTCTAPFVYGEQPADPVCSAYLIGVLEHYKLTGNTSLIAQHYESLKAWNLFLKSRAIDGIVDYSYYGDWAGPADCCYSTQTIGNSDVIKPEEYDPGAANSVFVSGEMMSTAIYYMNLNIMAKFSNLINAGDEDSFYAEANRIQEAFLKKWFSRENVSVHNDSQAVLALSLFVGIIPEGYQKTLAKKLADRVIGDGYRIKTANITTPMLFNVLSEFGYEDIAWRLFVAEEYPSFGFMLRNGATTMWERFELKKESGMNSHNHPMYGASIGYLYNSLAGFCVKEPNKEYLLSPRMPKDLLYFEVKIPILSGEIYLKVEKKYGIVNIFVDVPFGITINLEFEGKKYKLKHGFQSVCEVLK